MREDFLYHLWKFQKFNSGDLRSTDGETLMVLHPGSQNHLSGPDFFNSKIQIGAQLWAGNVEIHIKASDWYLHHHETDANYDNVILHVVWENDTEIFRSNESQIPCLALKELVSSEIMLNFSHLLEKKHEMINCEQHFGKFDSFQMEHWLERLYFERLESKSEEIQEILSKNDNNWEATLFVLLAKSFGLNINGEIFKEIALSLDFRIVQKIRNEVLNLEALFLGHASLINGEDNYALELQKKYGFFKHKFQIMDYLGKAKYFRLRPDNFPNIRLAQLAGLYARDNNLFQKLIVETDLPFLYQLFDFEISEYWQGHYNFEKSHPRRKKKLSRSFIDLVIINCIIPLKYSYFRFVGEENAEILNTIISQLPPEHNTVTNIFTRLRPGVPCNALESQSLIQLKRQYCELNKCLHCELGASLLRKSGNYA